MILPPQCRGDLTERQWKRLKTLLPAQKPETDRPNNDHRKTINGMLWILRTGAPWRDLPEDSAIALNSLDEFIESLSA